MENEPKPSIHLESPRAQAKREWNLDQLKKIAKSRGIPLQKLVAQMVEEYLSQEKG
jgi:hypothetical protein